MTTHYLAQWWKKGQLKLDPSEELEDDLVIPSDRERYAYHEVIFDRHKLVAVWSYSPSYASAEGAFSRFYDELVSHSSPDKAGDKSYDALGQRHISPGNVVLLRPQTGDSRTIGIDVDNGRVFVELKKAKDGAFRVTVQTVRNR